MGSLPSCSSFSPVFYHLALSLVVVVLLSNVVWAAPPVSHTNNNCSSVLAAIQGLDAAPKGTSSFKGTFIDKIIDSINQ